jgi:XRE family transcriptional regulator, regulator of sulfur utilization
VALPRDHSYHRRTEAIGTADMSQPSNTPDIGPVLMRYRKQHGLTLEQLAALSGVSKSMLSQVERGQANPTFAVLWSLTRALRIDLVDLVDGTGAVDPSAVIEITGRQQTPETRSTDGKCRLRILSPPKLAGSVEWYELEIDIAGALISSPHSPGSVEHLTVLAGELDVNTAGTVRRVKMGETARYPVDVAHQIANPGEIPARALLVNLYR